MHENPLVLSLDCGTCRSNRFSDLLDVRTSKIESAASPRSDLKIISGNLKLDCSEWEASVNLQGLEWHVHLTWLVSSTAAVFYRGFTPPNF